MAGNISSNLQNVLKILYPNGTPKDAIFERHPFLAMLKKTTNFGGHYMHVPVTVNAGSNASRTASTAFGNSNVSNTVGFAVTRARDFTVAEIPREDWVASRVSGDKGAFVNVAKYQVDTQMREITRRMAKDIYRSGSGSIGQVATSGISTTSLTLADTNDARYFEIGQEIAASSADGTGALRDSGNTATVTAVDRANGIITTDSNWASQISGITDDDYLFLEGDHDSPTTGTLGVKGLGAWLTTGSPGALFGVTRTTDTVRLSGVKSTVSANALREGFIDACVDLDVQTGGMPDVLLINPTRWATLAKELEADRIFNQPAKFGDKGQFSFRTLELATPYGVVKVVGDGDCPANRGYLLTLDDWEFASAEAAPSIFKEDGMYDRGSGDSYEVRIGYYGQLICRNPGHSAVLTIS